MLHITILRGLGVSGLVMKFAIVAGLVEDASHPRSVCCFGNPHFSSLLLPGPFLPSGTCVRRFGGFVSIGSSDDNRGGVVRCWKVVF
jgi:hypothetical protein